MHCMACSAAKSSLPMQTFSHTCIWEGLVLPVHFTERVAITGKGSQGLCKGLLPNCPFKGTPVSEPIQIDTPVLKLLCLVFHHPQQMNEALRCARALGKNTPFRVSPS